MTKTSFRLDARDLALVATFAALIAALGLVPALYPFGSAVPITAQSLGVMLAGAVLGARRGFLAVVLLLALVAIGLPLLASGRGGLGVFAGPTVGYLIGWPFAAAVTGWLTERFGAPYRLVPGVVANLVGGVLVLYAFGIAGTVWRTDLSVGTVTAGTGLFIVGDVAKAVIVAGIARGVHTARPGLLRRRRVRERV